MRNDLLTQRKAVDELLERSALYEKTVDLLRAYEVGNLDPIELGERLYGLYIGDRV